MKRKSYMPQTVDSLAKWPGWIEKPLECTAIGVVLDGKISAVDVVVCEFSCDEVCEAYVEYCKERKLRCRKSARGR